MPRQEIGSEIILKNALENGEIIDDDAKIIIHYIESRGKITITRKGIIAYAILKFRKYLPPFRDIDKSYKEDGFSEIPTAINRYRNESGDAESTQRNYISTFKSFLKWLVKNKINKNIDFGLIEDIKEKYVIGNRKAEDMLTGDELEAIFNSVKNNLKNKTFLQILYDSGSRVTEICTLKWKQVIFRGETVKIDVQSKTEHERRSPLLTYGASMKLWYNEYTKGMGCTEPDPEAYVFFSHRDFSKPMPYETAHNLIIRSAESAGVKKHVYPHLFRHTRVSDLIKSGKYSITDICMMMWGVEYTDSIKKYAHLLPDESADSMLAKAGIIRQEKVEPHRATVCTICPNRDCLEPNPGTAHFCMFCSTPLSDTAKSKTDAILDDLDNDPMSVRLKNALIREMDLIRKESRGDET